MNTRLRFKIIAILISLSLLGLLASQGYWLMGLYHSTWQKTDADIRESMRIADYKELFMRINNIEKNAKIENRSFSAQFSADISGYSDKDSTTITMPDQKTDSSGNTTTPADTIKEQENPFESMQDYLKLIGELEGYVQTMMHQKIDSIVPINYAVYDSLLSIELEERNIILPHKLEVIEIIQETLHVTASFNTKSKTGLWSSSDQYTYPIKTNLNQYYRLSINSPQQVVLRQMAGILISSSLLVLIIVIAFIYLIYTILRQKTVDELKTDFTNNMTHELKTPISVAFAANDVLLNYSEAVSDKQRKYLHIVQEQLTHLSGLVEQILTLSVENRSTFRLKPEPVQIAGLLAPLIEQQKLKAAKPVNITTDIPNGLLVTADRTHLYNIINNLVENAIKYSGEKPCDISIKAEKTDNEICLSVCDNGIGINDMNLKRIFEKFFRVPNGNLHNVKGYGLGLYYVKDMMARQGGTIDVKSQLGKGSVFTLHFKN